MIPIKLTETDYINPEAVTYVWLRPKEPTKAAAMLIVYADDNLLPLEFDGEQAEQAIFNWQKFHQKRATEDANDRDAQF
jgi:hypothetical protein